jgi:predicted RNase H-like nuclease (RuvC/YqgF family)
MELLTKLFTAIIEFARKFTELAVIGQILTIALLVFSTYYVTSCSNKGTVDNITVVFEETKKQNQTLKDSVVVLVDSAKQNEVTIRKLRIEISMMSAQRAALRATQARLEREIKVAPDTVTLVALQDTTIDNLKSQILVADAQIGQQETVIEMQANQLFLTKEALSVSEQRAALLENALDDTFNKLQKKDKLWGKIPLPNRKVVAATALVGGVYVGTRINK